MIDLFEQIFEQITSIIGKIIKPILRNPPPVLLPVPSPEPEPTPVITPEPEPILEFTPKKDFSKPTLWKYYPDKSKDIWYAINYKKYIQPDNELVLYFIDRIKFNVTYPEYLSIVYKSTGSVVNFTYYIDDARLCRESGQDNQDCNELQDFWMNPDYYIWNNLEGDCEDYSILIGSVCEKLSLPYMIVAGYVQYIGGIRDWWVELIYDNKVYIAQVNMFGGSMMRLLSNVKKEFKPYIMFNKKTSMTEYEEWYTRDIYR